MPSHKEARILNYSPKQILDLVLDIEKYPEFLPWCLEGKITQKFSDSHLNADLVIGFKGFVQKYSSDIKINQVENGFEVKVVAIEGPFKNLLNLWKITPLENAQNCSKVEFFIDFEFSSKMLNLMISPIFEKATNKMIEAFEQRAAKIYKQI